MSFNIKAQLQNCYIYRGITLVQLFHNKFDISSMLLLSFRNTLQNYNYKMQ